MDARDRMWQRVYLKSRELYMPIPEYEDADARLTANAAASGWYRRTPAGGHTQRRHGGLAHMPQPGNMLTCGALLELEWVMPSGEIRGFSFPASDKMPMLWSDSKQAIFVLPFMKRTACVFEPRKRENELAKVWAKGRGAVCASGANYAIPRMPVVYPALQISYQSDKFTHGRQKNYIHHFGPGVLAYFSQEPYGSSRAPQAVMIRGGKLSLTKHGIDG